MTSGLRPSGAISLGDAARTVVEHVLIELREAIRRDPTDQILRSRLAEFERIAAERIDGQSEPAKAAE